LVIENKFITMHGNMNVKPVYSFLSRITLPLCQVKKT